MIFYKAIIKPSLFLHVSLLRHCLTRPLVLLAVLGAHQVLIATALAIVPVGPPLRFGHVAETLGAHVVTRHPLLHAAEATDDGLGHFHLVVLLSHGMTNVAGVRFGTTGESEVSEGVFVVFALPVIREGLAHLELLDLLILHHLLVALCNGGQGVGRPDLIGRQGELHGFVAGRTLESHGLPRLVELLPDLDCLIAGVTLQH